MKFSFEKYCKFNPTVFLTSTVLILAFVILGVAFTDPSYPEGQDPFTLTLGTIQSFLCNEMGWFYLFSTTFFLAFVVWLMFSRYGSIKLGQDDDEPEYNLFTWFAMLFSAGMGIGLLFYGVAEPISIFANPPSTAIAANSVQAAREAMRYTFFHWGLHAWAIYIVLGLSLAYFAYRHKLPLLPRTVLYPLIGKRIYGFYGHLVDILAVLGTIFGVATSLGLGVKQVNSGLAHLNIMAQSTPNQIYLIIAITLVATLSVVSGVDKGIKILSETNLFFALTLLLFVFFCGPTTFLLKAMASNLGYYLNTLLETTFATNLYPGENTQFSTSIFYLSWWIAWSPFVGMFIARISKGRTIREFIGYVLIVPTMLTFAWMTVFGNTAIYLELYKGTKLVDAVNTNVATSLFVFLENLPMQGISCFLAIVVVVLFFVTSSDSASLVVDTITCGGKKNPPLWQKIFWAFTEGLVAIILLLGGGLTAIQTMVIILALPFALVMLLSCYSLLKGLRFDLSVKDAKLKLNDHDAILSRDAIAIPSIQHVNTAITRDRNLLSEEVVSNVDMVEQLQDVKRNEESFDDWRNRLAMLNRKESKNYLFDQMGVDGKEEVSELDDELIAFIRDIVTPAFEELKPELVKYNREVRIEQGLHQATIVISRDGWEELYYSVRAQAYHRFGYTFPTFAPTDVEMDCYGQIILRSGTRSTRRISEFTHEGLIHDILNEYEKWATL